MPCNNNNNNIIITAEEIEYLYEEILSNYEDVDKEEAFDYYDD